MTSGSETPMSEYAVTDPATGVVLRTYDTATDGDVARAVSSAATAASGWSRSSTLEERVALLRRVADLHTERRDELAAMIGREMGKPAGEALGEVDFSADIYRFYADNAATFLADESIELLGGEGTAVIRRGPVGVLLGIMPWNFPCYQVARFAGPNLLAGNTILLKHAPQCPESAAAIESIFADAGFPDGAYVNVYATNDQVAAIIADPRVAGISLTGSERAGAAVAEIAGRHLKKVVLELGGSDPFLLLDTDDLEAVVDSAVAARIDNAGQVCNGAKRFIVADHLYDEFLRLFSEAMQLAADSIAPLSSERAASGLRAQLDQAVAAGATLAGGEVRGARCAPGTLTDIGPDNPVRHEELFGPVAMVFRARSEDEAVSLANDTAYGLGSYVFTTNPDQARRVADRLDVGMVFINGVMLDSPELPFGGIKRSGFGRELGRFGIEEFVNKKLIRTLR